MSVLYFKYTLATLRQSLSDAVLTKEDYHNMPQRAGTAWKRATRPTSPHPRCPSWR